MPIHWISIIHIFTVQSAEIISFKLYVNSYQIFNDEVLDENEFILWENIVECSKWRKSVLEPHLTKQHGHLIITIKIHDEDADRDSFLTFVDVMSFDHQFTDKIMSGHTDIEIDEKTVSDFTANWHWDLFALRNLLLAIDQARTEGYELNDVSLTEERAIAHVISHRLKTDYKVNLVSFITDDNECFQQTLNTLEFWLKFRSWLSTELGHKLNIKHDDSQEDSDQGNADSEEYESEDENGDSTSFSRFQNDLSNHKPKHNKEENKEDPNDLMEEVQNERRRKLRLDVSDDVIKMPKVVSPKHQTGIFSSEYATPRDNNQSSSNDMQINENDIINYLK